MSSTPSAPAMDLITLPHHAELLSDRWLEQAASFFRDALPPRRAALAGPGRRRTLELST